MTTNTAIRSGTYIIIASLFVATFSLLLLHSFDLAIALFLVGFILLLLVYDPYLGLISCLLFLYVRPNDYVPGLLGTRMFLIMIVATFASMLLNYTVNKKKIELFRNPQDYLLVWFFVAIFASHLANLDAQRGLNATWSFVRNVVIYLLITNMVTTRRRLRMTIYTLLLGTVFLTLLGILQEVRGYGLSGIAPIKGRIRAFGVSSDPNMYAQTILVALPFFYYLFSTTKNFWMKVYSISSMLVIIYVIYLTNSRGGNLSLGALAGIMVIRAKGWKIGVPLAALAMVAVFVFGPSRMEEVGIHQEGRVYLWNQGFKFFQSHPLFGIGKDAWGPKYHMTYAHNAFIQCAAEMGLVGLFAWVTLIFVAMKNTIFVARHGNDVDANLSVDSEAIFFAIVAFLLPSIFLSQTYYWLLYILLALAAAATNIFVGESPHEYRLVERGDLLRGAAIACAGLVVFKIFVSFALLGSPM